MTRADVPSEEQPPSPDSSELDALAAEAWRESRTEAQQPVEEEPGGDPRPRRDRRPILLALLPVLLGLTGWNAVRLAGGREMRAPQMPPILGRAAIYLAVERIEEQRSATGSLPAGLQELGLSMQGLTYAPQESTYVVQAALDAVPVTYRSGQDLEPFARSYREWTGGGDR